MSGKVYLVGAGPGDPGLLTLKGRQALENCECVLYDHLVNPVILDFAPDVAERIYVGKSTGRHCLSQQQINELLISCARAGGVVVRLKGGDPFLFGRGGEEAEALSAAGLPWEVVPGVSAALAVPAYAGIPVTHRHLASSLAVVTAHEDACRGRPRVAWDKLATGADTLVVLMCSHNLADVASRLMAHGRAPETPAAFIQWGTYDHQQVELGVLRDIAERASARRMGPPSLLVVGEVVSLRDKLEGRFSRLDFEVLLYQ